MNVAFGDTGFVKRHQAARIAMRQRVEEKRSYSAENRGVRADAESEDNQTGSRRSKVLTERSKAKPNVLPKFRRNPVPLDFNPLAFDAAFFGSGHV